MYKFFAKNFWSSRRVLLVQHGRFDDTCKPAIFAFSCTHVLILLPIQSRIQSLLASSKNLEDSVACVASVSVRFWSKERGASLARPKPRIPFLGLSLLRNQTETLATQAMKILVQDCFLLPSKCQFLIREKNTNHSSTHVT